MNFKYKIKMKMKKVFYLAVLTAIVLTGCTAPFKKMKDGSGAEYKMIVNKDGKKAVKGDVFQLNITAKYKDSVLFSTAESSQPRFIPYDTAQLPDFFKTVHEGDSLIIRISTDTLFKKGQSQPFMKKGQFIYQYFKVAKIFSSQAQADSVAKKYEEAAQVFASKKALEEVEKNIAANKEQMKKDDAIIAEYIAKNNLKAEKTKWGTYVVITTPGTGPMLTDKDIAEVNYTGRNPKDSVFDSNTDPSFGHTEPYPVKLNEFGVIAGWIDGLKMMQKGSVGKFIIPSTLAYGKKARDKNIGENEILVFDIAVADVLNEEQYELRMATRQQEMMEKQMKMREAMANKQKEKQGKASADSAAGKK